MHHCLDLKNKTAWVELLNRFPPLETDIFFRPEYYESFERRGEGIANCFVFEQEGDILLYPFLINPIASHLLPESRSQYYDITGAYGYNGVLSTTTDAAFTAAFQKEFLNFCSKTKIIAEFTRFNPLIKNEFFLAYMKLVQVNKNIVVDLKPSEEAIWSDSYSYAIRKSVNKAKRNQLEVIVCRGDEVEQKGYLKSFMDIFYATLERNEADPSSYFDQKYIHHLTTALPNNVLFFFARFGKKIVSTEMVLLSPNIGYSFLGGTLQEAYDYRPNHLLKDYLIRHLKKIGIEYYCIGGGKTMDDGIFRYKNSFAVNGVYPFYIGTKVHNEEIYYEICKKWAVNNPEKSAKYDHFLFKYKY